MTSEEISIHINTLGQFCGVRDIETLTKEALSAKYSITQADIMVLFGGSIIAGGDVLAEAIKNKIAKKYIIVGGAGHTTQTLRDTVNSFYPDIDTKDQSEAWIFSSYIKSKFGVDVDYLETKSTNCGNNITYLLELIKENNLSYETIILSQDATMQKRMSAGFIKYEPHKTVINYATYSVKVTFQNDILMYNKTIDGMWEIDRYISLLLGEIPRLRDDENGYGPNGKNYISHVDIPNEVDFAFNQLCSDYSNLVREANPLFASK